MTPIGGSVVGFRTLGYQGPGDIAPGALGWWGLRAYSSATTGSNAIRLRRDSDNAESDFTTDSDGDLDVGAISTFKTGAGAAELWLVTFYDQTGNGNTATNSTTSKQSKLLLADLGSLPVILANASSGGIPGTAGWATAAQPISVAYVFNLNTSNFVYMYIVAEAQGNPFGNFPDTTSHQLQAGATLSVTDSAAWRAYGDLFNGSSSAAYIDGSLAGSGNAGTNSLVNGQTFYILRESWHNPSCKFTEIGFWGSNISGSFGALSSNQHSYWGF